MDFGRGDLLLRHNSDDYAPVEQFIGLTDRNGTPIYEGDIMGGDGFRNCPVRWNAEYAWFELVDEYIKTERKGHEFGEWVGHRIGMIVIGNIHETPELLETSSD
jgi:uncharacterized phage protein (TIGR01671 family)